MKKVICVLLTALMLLATTGCQKENEKPEVKFRVGVIQLAQHEALDAATQGFKDALEKEFGGTVKVEVLNASGEGSNCTTIVNGFLAENVDLIMANATLALQAAAAATDKVPILGTSITDYGSALELENFNGTVGGNISGTSDLAPLDQQAAMIKELFPEAKTVGILYCSAEANSKFQSDSITAYLTEAGLEVKEFTFTDSNDVASVTQAACDEVDVIFIPTDNTAASNAEAIGNVVVAAGKPVIAGEESLCKGCGVATLSISYYDLGYTTGKMAVEILKGEADISTMAVQYAAASTKKYNKTIVEKLNLTMPEDYEAISE